MVNIEAPKVSGQLIKRNRQINNANIDIFKTKVGETDWRPVNNPDVNVGYDLFHRNLSLIYEESFPVHEKIYKLFKNKYKPWLTTAILNSLKEKNRLYKKYMQAKTLESRLNYCNYKKN